MADKQFLKGVVAGALCASLAIGGGFVAYAKAGYAGSSILSDVAVTQKIKYLEDMIDEEYLEEVDEESSKRRPLYRTSLRSRRSLHQILHRGRIRCRDKRNRRRLFRNRNQHYPEHRGRRAGSDLLRGRTGRSGWNERGRCDQRRKRN